MWQAALRAVASLQLTLLAIVAFAAMVVLGYAGNWPMTWPVAAPMLVLTANLVAAIATNAAFRRQLPLMVFHFALLLLALLVVLGRLSFLRGNAEVPVGGEFVGLTRAETGPWHMGAIDRVRFFNDGFAVNYLPGVKRDKTRNRVRWTDEAGAPRGAEIGDNRPLVVHGYRFYPTHNKGFAPLFVWQANGRPPVRGGVHLPAYPSNELKQSRDWELPGTSVTVWCQLVLRSEVLKPDEAWDFAPPREHEIVVRRDNERWVMKPGDSRALPEGLLIYEGLGMWMGYEVFYDWTLPWLLGVALVAVAAMAWHFSKKYLVRR